MQESSQQSSFLHDVSEMNSFHQDPAALESVEDEGREVERREVERRSLSVSLDKEKSTSSLVTRRADSCGIEADTRDSWNSFKFTFKDENFS